MTYSHHIQRALADERQRTLIDTVPSQRARRRGRGSGRRVTIARRRFRRLAFGA